jgi:hypothetical protein
MENRHREIVETDSGIGMLFEDEEFIGEVNYRYKISLEYSGAQGKTSTEETQGLQNLHGSFSTNSMQDLLGKELRLITAKRKELHISVMAGDSVVKVYIFVFGQGYQRLEIK